VYYPGSVEDVEVVVHQVDVWSTKDQGKLLWVGKAETYDPESNKETSDSAIQTVVKELTVQGMIPAKKA
jgi:NADPH-dependent curcumin reductase CurA